MKGCHRNIFYTLFWRTILIYGVFAQHEPLKTRIFHLESFCLPKHATLKVFAFYASGLYLHNNLLLGATPSQ